MFYRGGCGLSQGDLQPALSGDSSGPGYAYFSMDVLYLSHFDSVVTDRLPTGEKAVAGASQYLKAVLAGAEISMDQRMIKKIA
jgi:hypothetical protein